MSQRIIAVLALMCWGSIALAQTPLGTGFTYQGELTRAGQPINGSANLTFKLYDASSGGPFSERRRSAAFPSMAESSPSS